MALLLGTVFFGQTYDTSGALNVNASIFVSITNLSFANLYPVLLVFCMELPIFLREHFNGTYRVDSYFITKQLAELPIYLTTPVIYVSIYYWMVGLNPDIDRFFIALLIFELLVQTVISFGRVFSQLFLPAQGRNLAY